MTMTHKQQSQFGNRLNAALTVCNQITRMAPNPAYICGGAPRDILFGRHPKDFDIFVPVRSDQVEPTAKRIQRWWHGRFGDLLPNYAGKAAGYSHMREEVLGTIKSKDSNIDVVFVDAKFGVTPAAIVAKFDNSMSMVWVTPDGRIDHTSLFLYSVGRKVLIAIPCNVQTDAHLMRVAAKFPDFSLVA
jgi:hypothetical protein